MQFSTLALSALLGLASAQTTGTAVTVVKVGENGTTTFSPNNIKVSPGGMVQFQFWGGNHTATQSTFDQPCQPVSSFSNVTGFHSGFVPAAASAAMGMIPTYTIMVNNTNALWVYCGQAKHCENGMSMVINENTAANSTKSLDTYKQMAKGVGSTVVPNGANSGTSGTTTGAPGASGSAAAGTGAGSMLSVPSTFGLLALAAGVLFV